MMDDASSEPVTSRVSGLLTASQGRDEALALALDATQTCIWDFDVTRNRVTLDAQWSRMRGGPAIPTQATIQELHLVIHEQDRALARQASFDCIAGRSEEYSQEYRVNDFHGSWIWIHSRGRVLQRDERGRALRIVGTNIDISQRKASELAASRRMDFLRALNVLTVALLQRQGKHDILETLAASSAELLDSSLVEVALVEHDKLVTHASGGPGHPICDGRRTQRGESPLAWQAIDSREAVVVDDYCAMEGAVPLYRDAAVRAVAVFPILYGARCLGVLAFMRHRHGQLFSPEDREKGALLSQLAALAIHNASIYEHAVQVAEARTHALRESEKLYRTLVESVSHAHYVANRRSVFTYCNPAFYAMGGYEPAELERQSSFRLVAEEDRPRVMATYQKWISDPAVINAVCEFRAVSKTGRKFWVEQTTTFVRDPAGHVIEGRNLLQDITARKQADEAIRESEERFRAVFDQSPVAVALLTVPDGVIVQANASAETMFRLKQHEAIGRTSVDLRLWVEEAQRNEYLRLLQQDGKVAGVEARMRRSDGEIFTALYSGCMVSIRGRRYTLNSIQDITPRKQAEDASVRSLAIARATLESTTDGILVLDARGRIETYNAHFSRIWGIPAELLRDGDNDRAFSSVLPQLENPQRFLAHVQEQNALPKAESFEEIRFKDGRVVECYSHPLIVGGQPAGRVWSFRDVSQSRAAEAALRQSEAQLRQAQKMESLGTLAGGIAHDFNNILTGILGYTQLALVDLDPAHPARQWLEGTLKSGERAKNLVSQILTFSRKTESTRSPIRLQQVVIEAVELLRSSLPAMVSLDVAIDTECATVHANANEFHQVILNLCTNSWHALPAQGGRIGIMLAPVAVTPEYAHAHPPLRPGPHVRLRVEDNGCGMSAATVERIFEPFFTTKEAGKGTGLGLAVVHSVVTAHGGGVFVHSEVGKGTSFDIFVPVMAGEEAATPAATSPDLPRGAAQPILVVDDEPASGGVITRLAERLGYRPTYCSDPREALGMLRHGRYAALVTDLAMPNLTGDELAREAIAQRPGLPVLLLSGFIEPATMEKLRQIGVREVLAKPPSFGDLAAALHRCVAK